MSFFGKNIKKIRGVKGLSQQAFADLFDLKRGTLGAYEEGRSEPRIETIIKIANHFSIQIDTLLTQELTVNQLLRFNDALTIAPDGINKEEFATVACVTDTLVSDYVAHHANDLFINDLPILKLPINTTKKFRAFTVTSLEMTTHDKGLLPKDIVIGEYVPKSVISKLNNGTVVAVVTKDALILRRLYTATDAIILRADHKNVEDVRLQEKDILELWRVRYVFYRRVPDVSSSFEDKLATLEQQMAILSNAAKSV